MISPFQKSFDEILDDILTDYRNQFPEADTSRGSLIFIKASTAASALWGLYREQAWIGDQIFPDTADTENLEHHGWVRDITRRAGETDAELLARILDDIRRPPAGGNRYDYPKWAKEIAYVAGAYCTPIADGLGTVTVVIVADEGDTGSEVPSTSARKGTVTTVTAGKLIDSAADFTTAARPVHVGDVVRNTVKGVETTVATVDSATQLTLNDDIFHFLGENYHVHFHTGTATSASEGKLVDSAAAFNDGTYTCHKGDTVENRDAGTETEVLSVDSATQVSLKDDIFPAGNEHYVIRGLVSQVKEHIDDVRPVTASKVSVLPVAVVTQAVTMVMTGTSANRVQAAADVAAYLSAMVPGQTLYKAALIAIGMANGADNVTVSVPAADVTATISQMIRAGAINVS